MTAYRSVLQLKVALPPFVPLSRVFVPFDTQKSLSHSFLPTTPWLIPISRRPLDASCQIHWRTRSPTSGSPATLITFSSPRWIRFWIKMNQMCLLLLSMHSCMKAWRSTDLVLKT